MVNRTSLLLFGNNIPKHFDVMKTSVAGSQIYLRSTLSGCGMCEISVVVVGMFFDSRVENFPLVMISIALKCVVLFFLCCVGFWV